MTRHPFDPVALVFGLAFAAAGVIVLTGGELIDEGRVLVPLGLVALGVGLLFRPARPAPPQPAPTVPFGYTDPADRGPSVSQPPTWPTEPDRSGPTDAPTADVPAPAAAPEAPPASRLEQPAVDDGGPDRPGDTEGEPRPRTPGAEFYLGRDWQAPDDEPGDDAPGR